MRPLIHRKIYVVLLCLIAGAMTTSVFATNLLWVLLLANWVAEWNWKEKFADFRHNYLLQAFLVLVAVHLVWLIGTANMGYGLFDLQKKLPLIALPLVILTTRPLNAKEALNVGICYVGTVFVVSIIGLVRHLTIPDLPYREIVPYISHIRFGLNVCLSIVLLPYAAFRYRKPWLYGVSLAVTLWYLCFLFLLHAYTAFIILFVMSVTLAIVYRRRMTRRSRILIASVLSAITLAVGLLAAIYTHDYYHLQKLSTQPLAAMTPNGRPYIHHDDGIIENGNYIHHYICEEEMRQEWAKMSAFPFDSLTATGYTIYPTLLRYLNGLGLTKDSLGMAHLSPADIAAIEKGIANPVYLQHGPRKMAYAFLYEYESHRCYHSVSNFSMLQRIELWKNGLQVFLHHPIFGVGTGDVPDVCHENLVMEQSPLADTNLHTHNQYLNFLIAFGLLGFIIIAFCFVRAIHKERHCSSVVFTAFLCILLISFISEDTLETLAGITFAALGFVLLAPRKSELVKS